MTPTSAPLFREITLSALSLAQVAAILLVSLPFAVLVGFTVGRSTRKRLGEEVREIDSVVGQTTMGAFLALLGLLIAFTFGNALTTSQSIKDAITREAAALGTAFLRADFLADPGRTSLQTAILDYARTRVAPRGEPIHTRDEALAFLETTLHAQSRLWPLTLKASHDPTPPPIQTFVAGAMNEVLDAHLYRMATLSVPISAFTQAIALAAAITAVFLVGNRAGLLGRALTWRVYAFALFLCAIMYTIVDIRRGSAGLIQVDDSALHATIFEMEQALANRH